MTWLGGERDDWKVAIRFVCLEDFHHPEAIHTGHLQIEQNQVVAVFPMQRADLLWIRRRGNAGVAGFTQQLFKQTDIGLLIVNNQDAGVKNGRCTYHHLFSSLLARADCAFANFSATSSVSMNSLTLIGLVR